MRRRWKAFIWRAVVRGLTHDKTSRLLHDMGQDADAWRVHYAIFSRLGLTPAAPGALRAVGSRQLDLDRLDRGLAE